MNGSPRDLPSPLSPGVESRAGLLRALGPGMAIAMVVGNVIGSGIFLMPGEIAADAGRFPLIITAWIVGGLVCILGALSFAELAVMLPRAGGLYVYLREAYGRPVAFLFGWSEFLFSKPASIGALSVAFTGAFAEAAGLTLETLTSVLFALILIAVMAWVNIVGVIWGGRVQAATTLVKAAFLGLMALLPFALLAGGNAGVDFENYRSTSVPLKQTLGAQFAAAMLAVMWAYNGWHGITPIAEEIREPHRNIPLALFGGIGILILLYVAANFAYHGVLSMDELAEAGRSASQSMIHKLLAPAGTGFAHAGVAAMSAVIMCSTFGAINSNLLNGPRVSFAMGRDDVFFRPLGQVHVNYRTPAVAISVMALMSAVLVAATGLYVEFAAGNGMVATAEASSETAANPKDAMSSIFMMLISFVVFSASLFYVLAVAAVLVLRRKRPEWERPYRTWGYPVVPLVYLGFYAWFLYHVYQGKPLEAKVGLLLVALGLPVYFGWRAWAARHPQGSRP